MDNGLDFNSSNAPTSDVDMDGVFDIDEYIADTHANDNTDFPRIVAISNQMGRTVFFPSSSARLYRLQGIKDLKGVQTWIFLPPSKMGNNSEQTFNDLVEDAYHMYRITAEIP